MENIIEYLVKKERDSADTAKIFGLFAAAFVLTVLSFMFLKGFAIIGAAAAIYLAYFFSLNFNLEFEYCILDKDIIIDKIMSKKKRKNLVSINGEDVLAIVPQSNTDVLNGYTAAKTLFAAEKKEAPENYIIIVKTQAGIMKVTVKFNDKIVEHFKRVMPSKIF